MLLMLYWARCLQCFTSWFNKYCYTCQSGICSLIISYTHIMICWHVHLLCDVCCCCICWYCIVFVCTYWLNKLYFVHVYWTFCEVFWLETDVIAAFVHMSSRFLPDHVYSFCRKWLSFSIVGMYCTFVNKYTKFYKLLFNVYMIMSAISTMHVVFNQEHNK